MEITIARHAGFCFGVRRATERLEAAIADKGRGERIYTLGTLIHNRVYNEWLAAQGVGVINMEQVESLADKACADSPVTVFVRAHGITKGDTERLSALVEKNPYFRYEDCTCPYVKKIHNIARTADEENGAAAVRY